jgi:hypothetical protein
MFTQLITTERPALIADIKSIQMNKRVDWKDFKVWMITPIIKHESTNNYVLLKHPIVIRRAITCIVNSTEMAGRFYLIKEMLNPHTYSHCLIQLIKTNQHALIQLLDIPSRYVTLKVRRHMANVDDQAMVEVLQKMYP